MNETCYLYIVNIIFNSCYCSSFMLILEKYIIPNANSTILGEAEDRYARLEGITPVLQLVTGRS
jgi:hypothetical protein